MTPETVIPRIKRLPRTEPQYYCNRCQKPLKNPVKKTSLYVWDGKNPVLICPACIQETDQYIWGDTKYLLQDGDEKP